MPKNTGLRRANQLHSQRLKEIRPFVDFNYDLREPLSRAAKRRIKKYHDEITALTNRPYQVYRPRNKSHLKDAQAFAQHGANLPGLKVAFLPTDGAHKMRLRFTPKGIQAKTNNVVMTDVALSVRQLLINPIKHVNARIQGNPAKQYTIQAGRYEIPHPYLPETVAQGVAKLVMAYGDKESPHYFGLWLHGLKAYRFEAQGSLHDYLQEKQKVIKEGKRERKKAARKRAREKQSP